MYSVESDSSPVRHGLDTWCQQYSVAKLFSALPFTFFHSLVLSAMQLLDFLLRKSLSASVSRSEASTLQIENLRRENADLFSLEYFGNETYF